MSAPGKRTIGIVLLLVGVAIGAALLVKFVFAAPRAKHVLLITLDTTRRDAVGFSANGRFKRSPTPILDALAKESLVPAEGLVAVPLTLPSHTTMLTGLEPFEHGLRDNTGFVVPKAGARSYRMLAEILADEGFATAAFTSSNPVGAATGIGQGFKTFDSPIERAGGGDLHFAERDAEATTDRAVAWLEGLRSANTFLWVHYFDPHHPWVAHDGFSGEIAKETKSLYLGEVAFMDQQIGRLLAAWKKARPLEESIVVVIGDHGEGLGEHRETTHGYLVYDTTLAVPMLVRSKGLAAGVKPMRAGTIDVFPTIMDAVGLDVPKGRWARSLFATERPARPPAYGETLYDWRQFSWSAVRVWRDGDLKLIDYGSKAELFDIAKDPGEKVDLAAARPADVLRLRRLLLAYLQAGATLADMRVDPGSSVAALPYVSGAGTDIPIEPGFEENPKLPAVIDRMDVVIGLDEVRDALDDAARAGGEAVAAALDRANRAADRVYPLDPSNPAVLFWTARTKLKLADSPAGFSKDARQRLLAEAAARLETYAGQRRRDVNGLNTALLCDWQLWIVSGDTLHLENLVKRADEAIARRLDDGLLYALKGRAHWDLGAWSKAEAAYEAAVLRSPDRVSFGEDLSRVRARTPRSR